MANQADVGLDLCLASHCVNLSMGQLLLAPASSSVTSEPEEHRTGQLGGRNEVMCM